MLRRIFGLVSSSSGMCTSFPGGGRFKKVQLTQPEKGIVDTRIASMKTATSVKPFERSRSLTRRAKRAKVVSSSCWRSCFRSTYTLHSRVTVAVIKGVSSGTALHTGKPIG